MKKHKEGRGSGGYAEAKSVGILYSYSTEGNHNSTNELIKRIENEGKTVKVMTFISGAKKTDTYAFPYFSEKDLSTSGKWTKREVEDFKNEPFDYLLSLDKGIDKYSKNILASSPAKCRVGRFAEGVSEYFEMMINHDDDGFASLLNQMHHYIKKVRNE
ncbi:hypothetical protein [Reichenbachiella sp. 5M10]|uniref:DUF6913 domain-containing protein n=1 Tax=Reichenbachiella sp. 5M10 TaxID=1889772 RepID=UPI00117AAF28|nr:hypothetical protein [Reichenbachiella sp. 5M10]